jgi:hypothetical protein
MAGFIPAIHVVLPVMRPQDVDARDESPGMTSNYRSPNAESIYFLAGAILESAGFAVSGFASDLPVVSAEA